MSLTNWTLQEMKAASDHLILTTLINERLKLRPHPLLAARLETIRMDIARNEGRRLFYDTETRLGKVKTEDLKLIQIACLLDTAVLSGKDDAKCRCYLDGVDVLDDGILHGIAGYANTKREARKLYAELISNKTLVINAHKTTRRELKVGKVRP
jgi:hypothetical protein